MSMYSGQQQASSFAGFTDAVQAVINRSCIIDYGIIKSIPAPGVVDVVVSVAKNPDDIKVLTCVLATVASGSVAVDVVPEEGDKVLVVYPKRYNDGMFDTEQQEVIIEETAEGYNMLSGVALLINQYRKNQHKNFVKIEKGAVSVNMLYNGDEETNLFKADVTEDNGISVEFKDKFKVAVDAEGKLSVQCSDIDIKTNEDNGLSLDTGKAKISIDTSGNVTVDAMSGKISIKNSSADLFSILDGMLQILNTSLATQGSPAAHTVVPQQFAQQKTQLGQLLQ